MPSLKWHSKENRDKSQDGEAVSRNVVSNS